MPAPVKGVKRYTVWDAFIRLAARAAPEDEDEPAWVKNKKFFTKVASHIKKSVEGKGLLDDDLHRDRASYVMEVNNRYVCALNCL